MPLPRHLRLRVIAALEDRVKQFRTREAIYPLRTPRDPLLLSDIVLQALPHDHAAFDEAAIRSRTLLTLEWDDATWSAWVVTLPSGVKLYCDSDDEETRVLASGGKNAGDESDRIFMTRLAESAGEDFGIGMDGDAPARVRSSMPRPFLVEFFVELLEGREAEASIQPALQAGRPGTGSLMEESRMAGGRDFRIEVERWLDLVMR